MAGICGGGDNGAKEARQQEEARQARITQGMGELNTAFAGFDPKFYKQRQDAYMNYAMPQLSEQAQQTQNQIIYGLADKGLSNSSVAERQQAKFQREMALQKQGIVDAAFGQANDLRKQVEGQKSNLIAQLQASGDPSSVSQQAIGTAAAFQAPSTYQPLSNLFGNFTNMYLANQIQKQADMNRKNNYGYNLAPTGGAQSIRN